MPLKKSVMHNLQFALVGMPNVGKSTLFNKLTGKNQCVGNWPGVTVQKHSGFLRLNNCEKVEIIDLPGCYSLISTEAMPLDEKLTTDFILSNPDVPLINVVDATTLHKDLYLTLQLLERKCRIILVLNKIDLARKMGINVNVDLLKQKLGCEVVSVSSKNANDILDLIAHLTLKIEQKLTSYSLIKPTDNKYQDLDTAIAVSRHAAINDLLQLVSGTTDKNFFGNKISSILDSIALNRFFGIPLFFMIMYAMFIFTISVGGSLQTYLDAGDLLTKIPTTNLLQVILVEGLGQGINITLSFAPSLFCLFLFLSFLEGSGYIARAAFVMDRFLRWLGLPGKAFVPMIIGFGCNVPGVMGTRTLDSHKERLLTILMLPFMSCSARLAIYVVFVAAFFQKSGYNVIFFLYLFGIVVALLTGMLMGNTLLQGSKTELVMELPRYELPMVNMLFRQAWHRLKSFLYKAGAVIVPLCMLLSAVTYYKAENSPFTLIETTGKKLTPIFAPMGMQKDNWPATVSLLTGVLAKEVVIGTLTSLYNQTEKQSVDLSNDASILGVISSKFVEKAAALAYLVFVLLYTPCISVLAAIAKEVNLRWAIFCVLWPTSVAYSSAIVCYQGLTFKQHPLDSTLWILGAISLVGIFIGILKFSSKLQGTSHKKLPTTIKLA